jgi:hypothetical protein
MAPQDRPVLAPLPAEGLPSPIDRVLKEAAERNQRIRTETQQAAMNLERLIQLVVGAEGAPAEFKPRLLADKPPSEWRVDSTSPAVIPATPETPVTAVPPAPRASDEPHPGAGADPDTRETPISDFASGSRPPLSEDEAAIFSASGPRSADPTAFAPPSGTPPMDPQRLRPEDGGIALAYAAGDMLFAKGEPAEIFFVVTEGRVSLFEPSTGFEIAVLGPGSSLGEQSILMGGVHSLSARALDRVVCTTVRADRLRTILDQQPGVVKPVFEAILLQLSMHNELRSQGNHLPL